MARMGLPALLAGAVIALSAGTADAALYGLEFGGIEGSQTLGTALSSGDGLRVNGDIANQSGDFRHTVNFTAGSEATTIQSGAAWFSIGPFSNSLRFELQDAGGGVLAQSSTPPNFDTPGVISSALSFAGLTPGESYKIVFSGTIFAEAANYDFKMAVTPIPAAALLLAPALAGLGYAGYRRRQTA
jgi:hypothetical protein